MAVPKRFKLKTKVKKLKYVKKQKIFNNEELIDYLVLKNFSKFYKYVILSKILFYSIINKFIII